MSKSVIICGGGASGFFAAINIASLHPDWNVKILEKSNKVLSKVKISGGGRCNVTNARTSPSELTPFYPRGGKKLYQLFKNFSTDNTVQWFAEKGVPIVSEKDLRMFPKSNTSQSIIDCFSSELKKHNVKLIKGEGMKSFQPITNGWEVQTSIGHIYQADYLVIATGSSERIWALLKEKDIPIVPPVPSLFTFNIKDKRLYDLMGTAFENVEVKITGTKLHEKGPLLITHWGLSGPAILKLSAVGARILADKKYSFSIRINFSGSMSPDDIKKLIIDAKEAAPKRKINNQCPHFVPKKYWENLLQVTGVSPDTLSGDLSKKQLNKLVEELSQGFFEVRGKSTFKEEFVTAGGVDLSSVNLTTMESKQHPGLYFTGEVLDIDALTGGFNFQACWSTAWALSQSIGKQEI